MKLYKYKDLNKNLLSSLINNYSYFSKFSSLNDPMEGKLPNEFLLKRFEDQWKVFCLAEENNIFLLWTHYANGHKGICIEYESYSEEEINELKNKGIFPNAKNKELAILNNAKKINYMGKKEFREYIDKIPNNNVEIIKIWKKEQEKGNEDKFLTHLREFYYIKKKEWSYEKEWRLVGNSNKSCVYPIGKMSKIYFGYKTSPEDKRMISELFKEKKEIEMYSSKINKYGEIEFKKFNPKEELKDIVKF